MGWATQAVRELNTGGRAQVRPLGGSMRGRIESGQLVAIRKVEVGELRVGDVIFVRWKGNYLLHLLKEVADGRSLIGNNLGRINGWVVESDVLGLVSKAED